MTDTPSPRISIIIPAYCASDHLHLSVESLQAQTFTDFEIIIVEDNSPDDGATLGKAHQLAEADPRIRVARTKVNSGCGPSRNVGLDIARGEYVTFLDADDSLAPVALKNLIDLADKNNADIVCFAMERVYPSGKVLGHVENAQASVYDDPEEISEIALNAFSPSVGHGRKTYPIHTISRLIRRSLLDEAGIRFPLPSASFERRFTLCLRRNAQSQSLCLHPRYLLPLPAASRVHNPRPAPRHDSAFCGVSREILRISESGKGCSTICTGQRHGLCPVGCESLRQTDVHLKQLFRLQAPLGERTGRHSLFPYRIRKISLAKYALQTQNRLLGLLPQTLVAVVCPHRGPGEIAGALGQELTSAKNGKIGIW